MVAFGLSVLRLPPAAFWAMSLPELAIVLRHAERAGTAPVRAELEGLMRRYPDGGDQSPR